MQRTFLCLNFLLLLGCRESSSEAEYSAFRERVRYLPESIDQVAGRYEYGLGLGGERLFLFVDSTFQYEEWSDLLRPDYPVRSIRGRYFLSHDSLAFQFQTYDYFPNYRPDKITSFWNSIDSRLRLIYLSSRYSPSILAVMGDNIFMFRHDQMDALRRDLSQLNFATEVAVLSDSERVGTRTMMRLSPDRKH